jgi:hypothetical protein
MKKDKLIINVVVGYMIKVMRNSTITEFRNEFSAIRHGDYDKFIKLINVEQPQIVAYNAGTIKTNNFSTESGDCDFLMLMASGNALKEFYKKTKLFYGDIFDSEIPDEIYEKLVEFEISLRMHGSNNGINERNLEETIDKICTLKGYSDDIFKRLHKGRDYINYVKHNNKKFKSHVEGVECFNDAFSCLIENNLVIL